MSVKEITVYLVAPIKMTVLASDDTGDVRITRILYMEPPCIADLMESCGDDGLDEDEREYCGAMIATTITALWEARTELARLVRDYPAT